MLLACMSTFPCSLAFDNALAVGAVYLPPVNVGVPSSITTSRKACLYALDRKTKEQRPKMKFICVAINAEEVQ
jgi:hypothetical protein